MRNAIRTVALAIVLLYLTGCSAAPTGGFVITDAKGSEYRTRSIRMSGSAQNGSGFSSSVNAQFAVKYLESDRFGAGESFLGGEARVPLTLASFTDMNGRRHELDGGWHWRHLSEDDFMK
jgi:hypothetical protein